MPVPTNCAIAGAVTDEGGNVESDATCGLRRGEPQNTDPQLAAALDAPRSRRCSPSRRPAPPWTSPPAAAGRSTSAACRARRARCATPARTSSTRRPRRRSRAAVRRSRSARRTRDRRSSARSTARPFTPCASPFDPGAAPGAHTLAVRAVDPQGKPDAHAGDVTFSFRRRDAATPAHAARRTPTPTPVVNRTVVVRRRSRGTVQGAACRRKRFVELDARRASRSGRRVDTKQGAVELTSIPKAGRAAGDGGVLRRHLRVTQSRGHHEPHAHRGARAVPEARRASAAAKKPKTRKLWGDGQGRVPHDRQVQRRDRPRHGVARAGLVRRHADARSREGVVRVRDKVKKRTVIVRAGKRYLARAAPLSWTDVRLPDDRPTGLRSTLGRRRDGRRR